MLTNDSDALQRIHTECVVTFGSSMIGINGTSYKSVSVLGQQR